MFELTQRYLNTLGRIPTADEYQDVLRMSRRGFFGSTAAILAAPYFGQGTMGDQCSRGPDGYAGPKGPGPCPAGPSGPPGTDGIAGLFTVEFAESLSGPWHGDMFVGDRFERIRQFAVDDIAVWEVGSTFRVPLNPLISGGGRVSVELKRIS